MRFKRKKKNKWTIPLIVHKSVKNKKTVSANIMNSQNQLYCFLTTQVIVDSSAVVFVVHIFTILDFGEFGNYKTELVSRIYSGAKLADCQGAPIMGELEPDLLEH